MPMRRWLWPDFTRRSVSSILLWKQTAKLWRKEDGERHACLRRICRWTYYCLALNRTAHRLDTGNHGPLAKIIFATEIALKPWGVICFSCMLKAYFLHNSFMRVFKESALMNVKTCSLIKHGKLKIISLKYSKALDGAPKKNHCEYNDTIVKMFTSKSLCTD